MGFPLQQLHFVFIPFMTPGHTIPLIDISRMVAERGVTVTIFSTPTNAKRFESVIAREVEAGFHIQVILLQLQLPLQQVGLPQSCETVDLLPSMDMVSKFVEATSLLQPSIEEFLKLLEPSPTCIVSDMCLPWTAHLAEKFDIPRILFPGFGCFSLLCLHYFRNSEAFDDVTSNPEELVVVPNLPDKIELTKAQVAVSGLVKPTTHHRGWKEIHDQMMETEEKAFGIVLNTQEELESYYIKEYGKAKGKKIWCVGPVSLCNRRNLDKAERGNDDASDHYEYYMKWLDSKEPNSVMYVCLGSLTRSGTSQMIELGLGLELSNRPFIWVMRETSSEFKKWLLEEKYEERVEGRGVIIHGWAPQVLILSHPSIGGFITHCGWNSTLEAICSGVPMITWPSFSEQFINEKLVVNILKIGIMAGVKAPIPFGYEEKAGVSVNRRDITRVIQKLMDEEEEGQMRRKRVQELSNLARKAMEEGGSSHANLTRLIQDVMEGSKFGRQMY